MTSVNRNQGFVSQNIGTDDTYRNSIHNHNNIRNKINNIIVYILFLIIISFISCYLYKNQNILFTISNIIKRMSNSKPNVHVNNYSTNVARKHANNIISIFNQNKNNKTIF